VINADMRGFFKSDGEATLLSEQEGTDYVDLIEWAAQQEWSNGNVGLSGVSYLALTQWRAAAMRPPSLKAICPWEGFSDIYRDLVFPGGVRESGFTNFWFGRLDKKRVKEDLVAEQDRRPLLDEGWAAKATELEKIEVPALICGSFSDHNLHSRGSFAGFTRAGSKQKWLYTHRTGKWAAYYSAEAIALQKRFFDHFLKGEANGMDQVAPVRLEVRESGEVVHQIRHENEWPLARTVWQRLYLRADGETQWEVPPASLQTSTRFPAGRLSFSHTFECDTELSGPMKAKIFAAVVDTDDLCLFLGVRKLRGDQHVVFEGSYGFGYDLVTRGWIRLSQRELDPERSKDYQPVHTHRQRQPMVSGQIELVEVELLPSSTLFRAGETLRLDIQGRYFFRRHPFLGQFPAGYETSPPGGLTVHCGGEHDSYLLLPVIPMSQS
jgi:putative CocE/NonD family hydrolase